MRWRGLTGVPPRFTWRGHVACGNRACTARFGHRSVVERSDPELLLSRTAMNAQQLRKAVAFFCWAVLQGDLSYAAPASSRCLSPAVVATKRPGPCRYTSKAAPQRQYSGNKQSKGTSSLFPWESRIWLSTPATEFQWRRTPVTRVESGGHTAGKAQFLIRHHRAPPSTEACTLQSAQLSAECLASVGRGACNAKSKASITSCASEGTDGREAAQTWSQVGRLAHSDVSHFVVKSHGLRGSAAVGFATRGSGSVAADPRRSSSILGQHEP